MTRRELKKEKRPPVPRAPAARLLLAALIVAYFALFYGVSHLKYRSFSYGTWI